MSNGKVVCNFDYEIRNKNLEKFLIDNNLFLDIKDGLNIKIEE